MITTLRRIAMVSVMLLSFAGHADERTDLRQKLSQLNQFQASFSQQVFSEGELLQTNTGSLSLSRPDKFRWLTESPDESLVLSDGQTMWYYNPFVEQVTLYQLEEAIQNTPLQLLISDDENLWNKYQVQQDNESYELIPKDPQDQARFTVAFNNKGQISEFGFDDGLGQRSEFVLSQWEAKSGFKTDYFQFSAPEGVLVDDQR